MHRRDEPRDKVREVWVVSRTLHLNMGFVGNHGGRKVERWSPGREHWQDVREDLADYQRSAPGGRDRCFGLEVGAAVEGDPHLALAVTVTARRFASPALLALWPRSRY